MVNHSSEPNKIASCRGLAVAAAMLLLTSGCAQDHGDVAGRAARPRRDSADWSELKPPQPSTSARFERLNSNYTGVDFLVPIDRDHPLNRLYAGGFICGGVVAGDFNGDDKPDLYLVNGPRANRLYLQTEAFRFQDATDSAHVGGKDAWGASAAAVDIDNDGDQDIYVCNYESPNQLYINQGNATFVESAQAFGLDVVDACLLSTFCDYDADGDLDFYLLTNRYDREGGLPTDMKLLADGGKVLLPEKYKKYYGLQPTGRNRGNLQFIGRADRLFRNNGDGTFSDVTQASGISTAPGHGLSATWFDYNDDGRFDLYVGNDFEDPDHLYRNNGDGTFTDTITECVPHTSWFSMGADAGDINNDGFVDFVIADMSSATHFGQKTTMGAMGKNAWFLENAFPRQYMRNALYLNTGTGRFMEIAYLSGIDSTDWTWAMKLADLDNDGLLDLYVTNGMSRNLNDSDQPFTIAHHVGKTKWDLYQDLPAMPQRNVVYRNQGDLRFEDVSREWQLDHLGMSFGAVTVDLDRDGDLDLVVANLDEPVSIYRNHSQTGNRLLVKLRGTESNSAGIGAKLTLTTPAGRQRRELIPVSGFLASQEPLVHFGLGEERIVSSLEIDWPSGHRQLLTDLGANRLYEITESKSAPTTPSPGETSPLFRPTDLEAVVPHRELPFDDYRRQPLLPQRMSQLGPGVAVADVDGDGDDDFFVAGAAGQAGMLYINRGSRGFRQAGSYPFNQAAAAEDLAPLFFDADGDRDLDLFVTSGGVESEPGEESLQDRLYLNNGKGQFVIAAESAIPSIRESSGAVAACDFDRDGDLDLFIGGRTIPGQYPLSPPSRLLQNDGGRFSDVTAEIAPELSDVGMITGALWSDADGDGWVDLWVTRDWGSLGFFKNEDGKLLDRSREAGLDQWRGRWNGIDGRDLDGDGDIDYVATNLGLNTKYHATPAHPALLYYGDFDGSGQMRLVEAEFEDQTLFPLRGRSCSSHAMPVLSERFPSYKDFALASLQTIYTEDCLSQAHRFEATTLESGVFLNHGDAGFSFAPLPNLVQASPGFGVVLTEVDGDGHADLIVAQNSFSPQVETGRMDGGLSLLLKGNGDATFTPVWPAASGIVVPGDAKGLSVIHLNDDAWPDILIGLNNDRPVSLTHQGSDATRIIAVRLSGPDGNPTAIGARVSLRLSSGSVQTAEVRAGSGYLSQSTSRLIFGLGHDQTPQAVDVVWPNGARTSHPIASGQYEIVIESS